METNHRMTQMPLINDGTDQFAPFVTSFQAPAWEGRVWKLRFPGLDGRSGASGNCVPKRELGNEVGNFGPWSSDWNRQGSAAIESFD
jgi:hypothetical protein